MPALPSAQQPWQSISPQLSHAMPERGRPTQHASQRNLPQDVQIPAPTRLWQASHVRSGLSSIACRALACAMRWFWLSSRWVDAGMMAIRFLAPSSAGAPATGVAGPPAGPAAAAPGGVAPAAAPPSSSPSSLKSVRHASSRPPWCCGGRTGESVPLAPARPTGLRQHSLAPAASGPGRPAGAAASVSLGLGGGDASRSRR